MGSVPRWVLAVVGVAVLVAAADVGLFILGHGSESPASAEPAAAGGKGSVAVIDPSNAHIVSRIAVGRQPTLVTAGYGSVWVLNKSAGTVTRIDAEKRNVVSTLEPDATANGLAAGAGGIWFVGRARHRASAPLEAARLERIDPASGAVDRAFDTRTGASVVAAGHGALWTTGYLGGHVRGAARSDARTGAMRRLDIGIYGDLVAADDGAVYYVASIGNRVARLSARTGQLTNSMNLVTDASLAAGLVPASPTGVAVGGGAVWISQSDGTVLRLDPRLHAITARISVCRNALAISYGEHAVWVACGDGTAVRIDPAHDRRSAVVTLGGLPRGIAAGEGAVWVTLN